MLKALAAPLRGKPPNGWHSSFTAWTTRVSNPVCSPRFRASASVSDQLAAFATGVLANIYEFHLYTRSFHPRLKRPPTRPLRPVIPSNASPLRITAAAGTKLAGAYSSGTVIIESGPCLSPSVADHPLRPATDRRLGRPLPHQLANQTRADLPATEPHIEHKRFTAKGPVSSKGDPTDQRLVSIRSSTKPDPQGQTETPPASPFLNITMSKSRSLTPGGRDLTPYERHEPNLTRLIPPPGTSRSIVR
ncbi:hypothetical protein Lal_00044869 [Lupinus albus]|nr:hypothetical protein Lal_00044869 [Lupinus albus]